MYINAEKAWENALCRLGDRGKSKKEIFFSTYVCHPSMANNEFPVQLLLRRWLDISDKIFPTPNIPRFVFAPETIGALAYLDKNIRHLKNNVVCGFNPVAWGMKGASATLRLALGKPLQIQH